MAQIAAEQEKNLFLSHSTIFLPSNLREFCGPFGFVPGASIPVIREYGSTLYVGLARAVSPTNTNFRLTFLLTRLQ